MSEFNDKKFNELMENRLKTAVFHHNFENDFGARKYNMDIAIKFFSIGFIDGFNDTKLWIKNLIYAMNKTVKDAEELTDKNTNIYWCDKYRDILHKYVDVKTELDELKNQNYYQNEKLNKRN